MKYKILLYIGIIFFLFIGSNALVYAFVLLKNYHDYHLGLHYMSLGMLMTGTFLLLVYLSSLMKAHEVSRYPVYHVTISTPIEKREKVSIQKYIVMSIVYVIVMIFVFYMGILEFLGPYADICIVFYIIISFILCIILFALYKRRYSNDACTSKVLSLMDQLQAFAIYDEYADDLFQNAVRSRYRAIFISFISIYTYFTLMIIDGLFNKRISYSMIIIFVTLVIIYRLIAVSFSDLQLIKALNSGNGKCVAGMLLRYYEETKYALKPQFNHHTFLLLTLYEQGAYTQMLDIANHVKTKNKRYKMYMDMFQLLGAEALGKKEEILYQIGKMTASWESGNKKQSLNKNCYMITRLVQAILDQDKIAFYNVYDEMQHVSRSWKIIVEKLRDDFEVM